MSPRTSVHQVQSASCQYSGPCALALSIVMRRASGLSHGGADVAPGETLKHVRSRRRQRAPGSPCRLSRKKRRQEQCPKPWGHAGLLTRRHQLPDGLVSWFSPSLGPSSFCAGQLDLSSWCRKPAESEGTGNSKGIKWTSISFLIGVFLNVFQITFYDENMNISMNDLAYLGKWFSSSVLQWNVNFP